MRSPRALWRLLRVNVLRDPLSPEAVAAGWALGMFVGCAVPFGLQLVVSVPIAIVMRVSKVGATIGTFITNPVTIFFIYPAQTYVVNRLLFGGSLSYSRLVNMEWTWQAVKRLGTEAVASFFIGGLLLATILTPITYFTVRSFVMRSRRRKCRRADTLGAVEAEAVDRIKPESRGQERRSRNTRGTEQG